MIEADTASSTCVQVEAEGQQARDDDVYYYMGERLKLQRKTENSGVLSEEAGKHESCGTHGHSLH